ncbi:hypothetical protein TBLA_0A06930 [Henningerozyma blattae CBS 6284]|uniref:GOLD domain-containing protein n=1 Tax=Henningerozyma blattae (strain ATCC 34711 / CBS 6284 / DSM 70876 / NBRC 10599 / NRRL Y-10934 / UCD 77-7) TaxID=1071380 RepID=I2GWI2_HENB6|nr:hypothetical protein TBLA_0A06930 [Tetrapisispora blattae CBS 6284]CCH58484.1 hypothetical protein TBLA_0A06930 [Tetrapisispora blattae CBS 6284]
MQQVKSILLVLGMLVMNVMSLHFEIPATKNPEPFCVRDFVAEGQLVVVNLESDGYIGDGQMLSLYVRDSTGNEYRRKRDFAGEVRVAFTAPSSVSFDVCLENVLTNGQKPLTRSIELDIESGAQARDWNKIKASEKLKPIEVELRMVEELTAEIVDELNYLKNREERLRDTNESTNSRVRNFSLLIIAVLIALGAFQLNYLKNYFKSKHII